MRSFVLVFVLLSYAVVLNDIDYLAASEHSEKQSTEEQQPDEEDKDEQVNVDALGTSVDEFSIYKTQSKDQKHTSWTQIDGSDALRTIQNIKSSRNKKRTADVVQRDKSSIPALGNKFYCVVGKVNNDGITNVDIENEIKFIFFSSGKKINKEEAQSMIYPVLRTLMDSKLQQQYADLCSLKISANEVDRKVQEIARGNSMTVEELSDHFTECGISMDIFKNHIKSRMLLQFMVQLIGDTAYVTSQDINEAEIKAKNDINQPRYHVMEIAFTSDGGMESDEQIKTRAEAILQLVKNGFSFKVLARAMSQGMYTGEAGDLGLKRLDCFDKSVAEVVKTLGVGDVSDVIKTKAGYSIVYVVDVADPGKAGRANTTYNFLSATVQYKGGLLTQKDIKKLNDVLPKILQSSSQAQFEKLCKQHGIECQMRSTSSPIDYELELIDKSKKTKKPAAMQSMENEDFVTIVMFVDENVPNASLPTKEELSNSLSAEKIEKEFIRNFQRLKATTHSRIHKHLLASVMK
jgi:peptidyl-prolyl cis-trans isomerase SurA